MSTEEKKNGEIDIKANLEAMQPIEELLKTTTTGTSPPSYAPALNDYLLQASLSGDIIYEWKLVSRFLALKMIIILKDFYETKGFLGPITQTFELRKIEIIRLLGSRKEPPFTTQRFLEILLHPELYKSTHKLMNAMEKLLLVTMPNERKRKKCGLTAD